MLVPRSTDSVTGVIVKLPSPVDSQRQAVSAVALRDTTSTRSASMNAE